MFTNTGLCLIQPPLGDKPKWTGLLPIQPTLGPVKVTAFTNTGLPTFGTSQSRQHSLIQDSPQSSHSQSRQRSTHPNPATFGTSQSGRVASFQICTRLGHFEVSPQYRCIVLVCCPLLGGLSSFGVPLSIGGFTVITLQESPLRSPI